MLSDECLTMKIGVTRDIITGVTVELMRIDMASMVIVVENSVFTVNEAVRRIVMGEWLIHHEAQNTHQRTG